jgi:TfoX/Sxy family transcriptional regulator of competence genes
MAQRPGTPDERYDDLVDDLLEDPAVSRAEKKGFGSAGLFAGGKLFVMLAHGRLVVKLPRQRVDALVASGDGVRFDPGHGRLMREWLSLDPASEADWLALAEEAKAFVAPPT